MVQCCTTACKTRLKGWMKAFICVLLTILMIVAYNVFFAGIQYGLLVMSKDWPPFIRNNIMTFAFFVVFLVIWLLFLCYSKAKGVLKRCCERCRAAVCPPVGINITHPAATSGPTPTLESPQRKITTSAPPSPASSRKSKTKTLPESHQSSRRKSLDSTYQCDVRLNLDDVRPTRDPTKNCDLGCCHGNHGYQNAERLVSTLV